MPSDTSYHISTAQSAVISLFEPKYPLPLYPFECGKKKKCCKKYKKEKRCKDCPKKAKD